MPTWTALLMLPFVGVLLYGLSLSIDCYASSTKRTGPLGKSTASQSASFGVLGSAAGSGVAPREHAFRLSGCLHPTLGVTFFHRR